LHQFQSSMKIRESDTLAAQNVLFLFVLIITKVRTCHMWFALHGDLLFSSESIIWVEVTHLSNFTNVSFNSISTLALCNSFNFLPITKTTPVQEFFLKPYHPVGPPEAWVNALFQLPNYPWHVFVRNPASTSALLIKMSQG
jgi:hypothetical protein